MLASKTCPVCGQVIKDNDFVVVLLLARFKPKEDKYDLECMSQTISSHLYCAEKKEGAPNALQSSNG